MRKNPIIISILALICTALPLSGQSAWVLNPLSERYYPSRDELRRDVYNLCDTLMQGRARGSAGHTDATVYLCRRFAQEGLMPIGGSYVKGFRMENGSVGHNVAGIIEGTRRDVNRRYVVVGAHYDHLGIIKGQLYPGADANASGVAAMLAVAHAMKGQRSIGFNYRSNLIFVAFDAHMDGRAGAEAFMESIRRGELVDPCTGVVITRDMIDMMVDIDQVGSTLVPVEPRHKNYLIALGADRFNGTEKAVMARCNKLYNSNLMLYHSYYGSERFTQLFYSIGDRKHFIKAGIPVVFFTSGITDFNNSIHDTPQTLDYDILARRSLLIFRFIEKML